MGEERVGEEVGVGLGLPRSIGRGIGVEPVAELHARCGAGRLARAGPRARDPPTHAVELVAEDLGVAIGLIHGPRHDRGGVGPSRPAEARLAVERRRRGRPTGRRGRRPARAPGRAASSSRRPRSRTACMRSGRRPGHRRSSRGARRAEGSRSGTDTKLSRCDQTTFSWRRVRSASEHENVPASRCVAADRHELRGEDFARRLDLGVPKPVERERGLELGLAVVGEDVVSVARAERSARTCAASRLARSTSACRTVTVSPARPRTRSRTNPRCSGRVERMAVDRSRRTSPPARRDQPGPAGRCAARSRAGRTARPRRAANRVRRGPGASSPVGDSRRSIDRAVVEVGRTDLAGRGQPRSVGDEPMARARPESDSSCAMRPTSRP